MIEAALKKLERDIGDGHKPPCSVCGSFLVIGRKTRGKSGGWAYSYSCSSSECSLQAGLAAVPWHAVVRKALASRIVALSLTAVGSITAVGVIGFASGLVEWGKGVDNDGGELPPLLKNVHSVWDVVRAEIQDSVNLQRPKTLEVMGFNMLTISAFMETAIDDPSSDGWTFRFYFMDPAFIEQNGSVVQREWAQTAKVQLQVMNSLVERNRDSLKVRGINVEVRAFKRWPAVHGFRLWGKELFLGIGRWDGEGRLAPPSDPFIHVKYSDDSGFAREMRALYENWNEHADRHGTPVLPN